MSKRYQGISVSDGIAVGSLFVLTATVKQDSAVENISITDEKSKLAEAVAKTKVEFGTLCETSADDARKAMSSNLEMLNESEFVGAVNQTIENNEVTAEYALTEVSNQLISLFEDMENEGFSEGAADIEDIRERLLKHLGDVSQPESEIEEPFVLVAHDLSAPEMALVDKSLIQAFVSDVGDETSKSAILAKSLGIPAVVGIGAVDKSFQTGSTVIVDGYAGEVIFEPTSEELQTYMDRAEEEAKQVPSRQH